MRIIHTSDWHLGQYFYGKTRQKEHQAFLNWLIEQACELNIDAIVVAGDIFDTGSPPSYARELFNQFVVDLNQANCQLIVLGGNHDSVAMLSESTQLLSCLNTQMIAAATQNVDDHLVEIKNKNSEVIGLLCGIPFIRSRDVMQSAAGQTGDDKKASLQNAISLYYQSIYEHALKKQQELNVNCPILMTGHLTTVNTQKSESVRDLYIGTLDAYPSNAFPDADYIALGHIHRAQQVGGQNHIRYCGSPIPLSFDELNKDKQVCLVEFTPLDKSDADEQSPERSHFHPNVTELLVPRFQPMAVIKGSIDEIEAQLTHFYADKALPTWLDIEVSAKDYISDIQQKITKMTEHLNVEVLLTRREKQARAQQATKQEKETLSELSIEEVFERRLQAEYDPESTLTEAEKEKSDKLKVKFRQVLGDVLSEVQTQDAAMEAKK